jgi:hypothetical protein
MKVAVNMTADAFFDAYCAPGLIGPTEELGGWVVYLPGEVPCICDTFEDAADMMREHLNRTSAPTAPPRPGETRREEE